MSFENKQVFIVDDDESVCRALKALLVTHGFVADTFPSAEKFFSAVPNSVAGCLVLDLHLEGINGWQAQKKLLKSGSQRQIIIITADKNVVLEEQAFNAGAVGFLQKPFHDRALVDLVNSAFESVDLGKWQGSNRMKTCKTLA